MKFIWVSIKINFHTKKCLEVLLTCNSEIVQTIIEKPAEIDSDSDIVIKIMIQAAKIP